MGLMSYAKELLPKWIGFKLSRWGLVKPPVPFVFTYSVTNLCQSRCKTCNIWQDYQKHPDLLKKELTLEEIEKIFKSIGHVYFFNISGGAPFLRKDLPQIVELACKYLTPKVMHTPTNALVPELIEKQTREIMEVIKKHGKNIPFTIKPSFDGVGKVHDEIRGVEGNWEKLLDTIERLKKLQKEYPNLHVGLGTVISKFNLPYIRETAEYAAKLDVDSYIHEVAEQRAELLNKNDPITPTPEEYKNAVKDFLEGYQKKNDKELDRLTQAFRLVYYDLTYRILKENRQVLPCYGGWSNVHINAWGDLWPCSILAYDKPMGNFRDFGYDFRKLWSSKQARDVRKYIADKNCACPMAGVAYSNILFSPKAMLQVLRRLF